MKYNSERVINKIAISHHKDDKLVEHVETTVIAMRGLLCGLISCTDSPELTKIFSEMMDDIDYNFKKFKDKSPFVTAVSSVLDDEIQFDNGFKLAAIHNQECCETHWLDFSNVKGDFGGLLFDLSGDNFFTRIPDYGIALEPINGFPVRVPGYGSNNGYYSANLTLILYGIDGEVIKTYEISECQTIT